MALREETDLSCSEDGRLLRDTEASSRFSRVIVLGTQGQRAICWVPGLVLALLALVVGAILIRSCRALQSSWHVSSNPQNQEKYLAGITTLQLATVAPNWLTNMTALPLATAAPNSLADSTTLPLATTAPNSSIILWLLHDCLPQDQGQETASFSGKLADALRQCEQTETCNAIAGSARSSSSGKYYLKQSFSLAGVNWQSGPQACDDYDFYFIQERTEARQLPNRLCGLVLDQAACTPGCIWTGGKCFTPVFSTTTTTTASVSLFCFALMMPFGKERSLLQVAAEKDSGIFACDAWAVYSGIEGDLAGKAITKLDHVPCNFTCGRRQTPVWAGGKPGGPWTYANSPTFKAAWDRIKKDGIYKQHDWTIKLDPDAVLFPDRLRPILAKSFHRKATHAPKGVFLKNCVFGMYGGAEVLSRNAVAQFVNEGWRCPSVWEIPQEDVRLRYCLNQLGAIMQDEFGAFCFRSCDATMSWSSKACCKEWYASCEGGHAAYHAMETAEEYRACLDKNLDSR